VDNKCITDSNKVALLRQVQPLGEKSKQMTAAHTKETQLTTCSL